MCFSSDYQKYKEKNRNRNTERTRNKNLDLWDFFIDPRPNMTATYLVLVNEIIRDLRNFYF